jgi:hypothetical protein
MKLLKRSIVLAMIAVVASWAGALTLEISKPDANPEAKSMNALLIARTTACHDPAQSRITASFVRSYGRELKRTQLKVVALQTPGTFAIVGAVPAGSLIDLAVTNPEYKNYEPRTLILSDSHGLQWASIKRFFTTPPTDSDVKSFLGELE